MIGVIVPCSVPLMLKGVSGRDKDYVVFVPRYFLISRSESRQHTDEVVIVPFFVLMMLESASGPDKRYVVFVWRPVLVIGRIESRRDKD